MADGNNPREWNVPRGRKPHSITIAPDNYLWVTTHDKALVRFNPIDPGSYHEVERDIPQLTAGIIPEPNPKRPDKHVWFASPANEQWVDPIYDFDVVKEKFDKYDLDPKARAQTVSAVCIKDRNTPTYSYHVAFAEPLAKQVGYIKFGEDGPTYFPLPKDDAQFDTWLWSVAVSTNQDKSSYTFWATGRQWEDHTTKRTKNGLYTHSPREKGSRWQRIEFQGDKQTPIHVITDSTYVWVGTTNPNTLCRYEIDEGRMKQSTKILPDEPRQLAFGPDGLIWVAGAQCIHRFKKDASVSYDSSVDLPEGSEAEGLVVGSEKGQPVVWYTSPKSKKIGKYTMPPEPSARTEVVLQAASSAPAGEMVEAPLVAEHTIGGDPTPGIPLTCRIVAEHAAFEDGSRECVVFTDSTGQVVFPRVQAGEVTEDIRLEVGYGTPEPENAVTLAVTDEGTEA
ncbi:MULTISPECIES: hypothetical protein [Streptomyces]|uniref:Uncharacterized protein n=1 Tax=Streptomyces ramulosus TaxID=47762 RepID=A0ABW1FBV8_9ACTN